MAETDVAAAGAEFLNTLLERLSLDVRVEAGAARPDAQVYNLVGNTAALMLKPNLRSAIALLGSQALSRAADERQRCVLDVDGRLEAREKLLEVAATDAARVVERTGRRAVLDGLSSSERRVVHNALADVDGIETRSEGEGDHRWLCVEQTPSS